MSLSDTLRRTVTVVLVAVILLVVPSIAQATFTDRAMVTGTVGTARLEAPTDVSGSYNCKSKFASIDKVSVDPSSVTASNGDGVGYRFELLIDGSLADSDSVESPSRTASVKLKGETTSFLADRTWTVRVRAEIAQWTSGWHTETFTCPWVGKDDGNF